MQTIILTVHIILAICITIFVLLQRSEGGALGALGGSQSASSLFTGRQAGNFLSRMTVYLFIGFIFTSLTLVILAKQTNVPEKISILPVEQTLPVSETTDAVVTDVPVSVDEVSEVVPAETPVASESEATSSENVPVTQE